MRKPTKCSPRNTENHGQWPDVAQARLPVLAARRAGHGHGHRQECLCYLVHEEDEGLPPLRAASTLPPWVEGGVRAIRGRQAVPLRTPQHKSIRTRIQEMRS